MKFRRLSIIVLTLALLVVTASAFTVKYGAVSDRVGNAGGQKPVAVGSETASPYYAICNDRSHGSGCAGRQTWCGPERDNYASAKADADAHKKENPSHDVTVYHVP